MLFTLTIFGATKKMEFIDQIIRRVQRRAEERDIALSLYAASVGQARKQEFYINCGISDTLDGRFDLIVLHVHIVTRNLISTGDKGVRLSNLVFKTMMDDMDMNLREMGVGDLSVGKRVKAMARAFYGRARAYDKAFKIEEKVGCDLEDDNKLTSSENLEFVLNRNIYGKKEPELEQLKMLAEYVRDTQNMLATSIGNSLKSGNVTFPSAPGER